MTDAFHFISVWLLLHYDFITSNALHTIDCAQNESCIDSTILCDPYDDCHIICNADNVCNEKTFICPTNSDKHCNIECIGTSCLHTTFDASNSLNGALKLSIIGNGMNDANVWSYGSLLCPNNGDCTIVSRSNNIQHNHISALYAHSLNITLFGTDTQSNVLYQSDVYCPMESAMYCDINIRKGMLSNANIYTTQHQFLWIICATSANCYDTQHPPTLYCGVRYQSECDILSDHSLTQCACYGSSNPNYYATTSTQTTVYHPTASIHSPSTTTAADLRYVIVILSSVIVLSLIAVCGFGVFAKMKRTARIQKDTKSAEFDSFPSTSYTNSNVKRLSIKKMSDVKFLQSDTSMVSPNSIQSGASSVQYTVNNLFGKEKEAQMQPPIPPVAPPSMPVGAQTVPGFGTQWNMNNAPQYFGATYGLSSNNAAPPMSYSGTVPMPIDIQRSAPIIIPGAPYGSHGRHPSTISESESNLMAMPYAPVNQIANIPLDGDIATENCPESAPEPDLPNTEDETEHVTDNEEEEADDGEMDNNTNELFMQLKRARYYKAKKNHVYQPSTSVSTKSQDPSIQTMIIREEDECEYRFGTHNNEVMSEHTNDANADVDCDGNKEDNDGTDGTQYTIKVTRHAVEEVDEAKEGELEYEDEENTEAMKHMNVIEDEETTTEYSFTENTSNWTATHTHTESESESQCVEEDEDADEGGNKDDLMMSVIYVTENSTGGL